MKKKGRLPDPPGLAFDWDFQDQFEVDRGRRRLPIAQRVYSRENRFVFSSDYPTVEEGWELEGRYRITMTHGIEITEFTLRPSTWVVDTAREARLRREDELPPGGIDRSAIGLVRLRDWKGAIGKVERAAPVFLASLGISGSAPPGLAVRRGRPRSDQWATWARQVLDTKEKFGGMKGVYEALEFEVWDVPPDTVKSRLRTLRSRGWLAGKGDGTLAGPLLEQADAQAKEK